MQECLALAKKRFEQDEYARSLGIILEALTPDTVQMSMELKKEMLNWFQRPHGGVIYSLADAAFSVLANNQNNLSVALDCSITYHSSPDPGSVLMVRGENLSTTARTAAFLFRVSAEREGRHLSVATMKSIAYRTGKPIDPDISVFTRTSGRAES
jgi:acyl-CoA thioesterase